LWNAIAITVVILWGTSVWTGYTGGLPWGFIHGLLVVPALIFALEILGWWRERQSAKREPPLPKPPKDGGHGIFGHMA